VSSSIFSVSSLLRFQTVCDIFIYQSIYSITHSTRMANLSSLSLSIHDHAPNFTIPTEECTLTTCSIIQAQLTYDPNLGGNLFFTVLFAFLLALHLLLGCYYRTWTYSIGTVFGLALEICGYVGRVKMHSNPFIQSPFFMYELFCPLLLSHFPILPRNTDLDG
jgi:hypothetical protein